MRHGNLFNELLGDVPGVVFDTETTGLDSDPYAEIVEFAAVRFEHGKVVGKFSARCNPGVPIGEGASKIHGIYDKDVADLAPLFAVLSDTGDVQALAQDAYPLAYNAPFDYSMLHRTLPFEVWRKGGAWDIPLFDPQCVWLDPLVWGRRFDSKWQNKLGQACKRHGVVLDNAHAAEADCIAAGELFYAYTLPMIGTKKLLADVIGEQIIYAEEGRKALEAYWAKRTKAAKR